jgi:perosamine synthetase
MNVRLFQPNVGDEELAAIKEVFDRSWIGLGPKVNEFEKAWSQYIGCADSVGLNSATAALHIALLAFRFPEGAKVLVPSMTFAATAFAPIYNRLTPVFVDCDPETISIDFDDLERKYTSDCVAVMPVHFGGHNVEMDHLMDFANAKGLKVIEDCAHTAGSSYKGKKIGTWGHIGCFSFEEKKAMTTGDGGMMCSDDLELTNPMRPVRWLGIDKDTWKREAENKDKAVVDARHWHYEINELGFKYNMNDLAASIGIVQLSKLDAMNAHRAQAIEKYLDGMKGLETITPLMPFDTANNNYWVFGVRTDNRDELIMHLRKQGIATGVHYMPLHHHPYFKQWDSANPNADRIWTSFVTLPLHARLTDEEIAYVLEGLHSFERSIVAA